MSNSLLLNSMVGEYRLIDFLGEGGMGEVYRGVHAKLGRVAAIKVLTSAARREQGFVERFFNEARIQESLHHPNIAALYDFCEVQGQPCIVMEYVDGDTLCDRVRPYGPLPPAEALRIFSAVVDAVAYVHAHGVIHRDIKSNNIKIGTSGQVKLLDFGIAKGGAGLWYALSGPAVENVNASALAGKAVGKTVKVEMSDGPAEIWQGDRLLGVGQADVTAQVGDWVELKLRRNGQERVERFQMTENRKTWTLTFRK